jgi:hypothetical protein
MNLCHINNKNILLLILSSILISICSDRVIADEQVNEKNFYNSINHRFL